MLNTVVADDIELDNIIWTIRQKSNGEILVGDTILNPGSLYVVTGSWVINVDGPQVLIITISASDKERNSKEENREITLINSSSC